MKSQANKSTQYTIRGIPPEVDRTLRNKAVQLKVSLNQLVVEELTRVAVGRSRKADFSGFVGKWIPDPAFDEIIASQRRIDWDKWK